jgi:hypothetical protein
MLIVSYCTGLELDHRFRNIEVPGLFWNGMAV